MPHADIATLIFELLIVLGAGLAAGAFCRWRGVSLLVGYLVVGAVIGQGGLRLLPAERHELELFAEAGALLLLFSVGIEFSLSELLKLVRFFLVGGAVQMTLVTIPLVLAARWLGWSWSAALLVGTAGALSSTVLVFRALHELEQVSTQHGKRGLGILLFQDVALVPLLMLVPLLTGEGDAPGWPRFAELALKSALFVAGTGITQRAIRRWMVPLLAQLRSVEIVVLFAVCMVGGFGWIASQLGLPAAVGALAAGLALSGNRLSSQMESILLPFRETFSAVFFVTLGTLLEPLSFLREPHILLGGIFGIVLLKTAAAAVALKSTGLGWRPALGMGIGLSQLGEFSFLLIAQGSSHGLISAADYNRMLFVAIATLIATPQLIRLGLSQLDGEIDHPDGAAKEATLAEQQALVIGLGPIGRQVASRLEMMGIDACLIDLSPINLQPFAQLGFRTHVGDARDIRTLERVGVAQSRLALVSVPVDAVAIEIVQSLRRANRTLRIIVRCRFEANVHDLERAGADGVISEEVEAAAPLVKLCEQMLHAGPR